MGRATVCWAPIALLLCNAAWGGDTVAGRPAVIDGDTLRIGSTVIGLFGIAAPSLNQTCESATGNPIPCGRHAAKALVDHVGTSSLSCETRGADAHHRTLAVCRLGGEDLNAWMVARGFAVSERFKAPDYFPQEKKAWALRRGLWAGVFADPTERQRDDYESAAPRPPGPREGASKVASKPASPTATVTASVR